MRRLVSCITSASLKKRCAFADSLRQHLESGTHIVTQSERRGAVLRAQADAALEFKFAAGQAQDESAYAGVLACVCTPLHSHHFRSAERGQPDNNRMQFHLHRPSKGSVPLDMCSSRCINLNARCSSNSSPDIPPSASTAYYGRRLNPSP